MAYAKYGQATALVGMVYPPAEPPATDPVYSFLASEFVDAPNGLVSSATQPVEWDFGDGHTVSVNDHTEAVSYAWKSPGVYTLTLRYSEADVPIRKSRSLLVKIGVASGNDSELSVPSNFWAVHWRIRVPGESTRLMFWVSPGKGYEKPTGGPDLDDEPTHFYNMAKELERLYASTILRFPVPRVESMVDGIYFLFDSEVLYAGQAVEFADYNRQIKECLAWQYTHEKAEGLTLWRMPDAPKTSYPEVFMITLYNSANSKADTFFNRHLHVYSPPGTPKWTTSDTVEYGPGQ